MKNLLLITLTFLSLSVYSQEVKWYTIEEAVELNKKEPRKIMIDVYTDWCGWCIKMDKNTFSHPVIANLLNENFYAVKFNAETGDTISFGGGTYIRDAGKTHPLATSFLGWRMSYPSIVYFTENIDYLGPMPGYKTPEQLEVILNFIASNKYTQVTMEEYQKTFITKIIPAAPSTVQPAK